jgi:hypothetical protein
MAPDGLFVMGAGETVIGQTDRLVADRGWRGVYRLVDSGLGDRRAIGA